MIPNQWYVVLDAAEVSKKPLGVKRFGVDMVFWRDAAGEIACQVDKCCHRGVRLSLGEVKGGCIECPFHAWKFDGEAEAEADYHERIRDQFAVNPSQDCSTCHR